LKQTLFNPTTALGTALKGSIQEGNMKKFRFDDAYEKVYEYSPDAHAYVFYASYIACGIDASMPENEQLRIVKEDYNYRD